MGRDREESAGARLTIVTLPNKGARRVSDMARTVWKVGVVLYVVAVMTLCFRLAIRVELCTREAPFADSLCCLVAWEGSSFPLITVCAGVGGLLSSLLALRRGRENVKAAGFIGVVLGFALGGALQDIVRHCCK